MMGLVLLAATARPQLAITEMMSKSADTFGYTTVTNDHDFWELTNFGTNTIDLAGYKFEDNKNPKRLLVTNGAAPLFIQAGESVIFVRNTVSTNEAQFRFWWGRCLGPNVQVRFYDAPGFSSYGDSLSIYDPAKKLVDTVDFGEATRGVSFVYDTNSGAFTALSSIGRGGACQAATADDVASPGVTTGPIPLRIVQHPTNLVVCAELDATFKVDVVGMPRPRAYQWFFNGSSLPGKTGAILTLPNVSPANEGMYSVSVANAFTTLISSNASLTLDRTPSAPVILAPPTVTTVATNRTARFSISVCAYPFATYQWYSNGVALAGAIYRTLFIPNCTLDMSGTEYCVQAQNPLGTNTACARLYVTPKPDLRFTELQAYPVTGCAEHHDWFEVTNFGTNAVNLLGYRFFDKFVLSSALIVTRPMVVQPNESVVFVKNPTATVFFDWWGADQLPRGLQVFPYGGFSLSKAGDALYLWSATAEDPNELIDSISYATNILGVSLRFDYDLAPFGCDSVPGEFGAFRASQCQDIGSPGYTVNPPPRFVSLARGAAGANVKWRGIEGFPYRLEFSTALPPYQWSPVGETTATNSLPVMTDPGATNSSRRFYRVLQLTP
jgi:hypothetical protein